MKDVQKVVRGQIYWRNSENYDMEIPSIISKHRPVLVVSNNICLAYSNAYTVVPITSSPRNRLLPTQVEFILNDKPNYLLCEQVYTLNKESLGDYIGTLSNQKMNEVDLALSKQLGVLPVEEDIVVNKKDIIEGIESTSDSDISCITGGSTSSDDTYKSVKDFDRYKLHRRKWSTEDKRRLVEDADGGVLSTSEVMDKWHLVNKKSYYATLSRFRRQLESEI